MVTNIFPHQSSRSNSTSLLVPLDCGQKVEKLDASDQAGQVGESTTSKTLKKYSTSKKTSKKEKQSVMQESVVPIKKKIYKDKSSSLKTDSQKQKSSKTLEVVSIGKDKDLTPFWNESTKEMSRQLWLPIETDFVDLESRSLNGSSKKLMLNSWFSTKSTMKKTVLSNSQKTYLQSLQSLLPEIMGLEQASIVEKDLKKMKKKEEKMKKKLNSLTEEEKEAKKMKSEEKKNKKIQSDKEKCLKNGKIYESPEEKKIKKQMNKELKIEKEKRKCIKQGIEYVTPEEKKKAACAKRIKIYYSKEEVKILNGWFGITRWIYNKGLDYIKNINPDASIDELRDKIVADSNFQTENKWMVSANENIGNRKNSVFDLRDEAIRDLLKNIKSNKAKGGNYELKYKSKKNNQSISVLDKYWNKGDKNFYKPIFNSKIKSSEILPEKLMYDSRITFDQLGHYYICIPEPLRLGCDNQAPEGSMIFIDPGSKNFVTCYDPSGKVIVWGKLDVGRIGRLLHYKNKLNSRMAKIKNSRKKKRMKLALLRMNKCIRNLVSDLHKKLSKWLCSNYSCIFIPRLNFHKMKKLKKMNKQKLASYSHCAFVNRLTCKAREYPGCNVIEVNESYTSMTCSSCGYQNKSLCNKDVFNCRSCKLNIGRDVNAAKNIMLRYFSQRAVVKGALVPYTITSALGPTPLNIL